MSPGNGEGQGKDAMWMSTDDLLAIGANENPRLHDDWSLIESLKKLDIKAPPHWNEYDDYVLNGGSLEYEEWISLRGTFHDQ